MVRREGTEGERTAARDHGQEVVEVVRHPTRQLANRFHLLGLIDRWLRPW